jgi:hypothetical protein
VGRSIATNNAPETEKPIDAWTPADLVAAIKAGTWADKIASMKRAGILTKDGKLSRKYTSWGKKVSRTPTADQLRQR